MNTKMIKYILARMLGVEAVLLLIPAVVGLIYGEKCWIWFIVTALILSLIFLIGGRKAPEKTRIYGKEGMVIVAMAWILWSFFGGLPFVFDGCIPSLVDAFFETVSGFTTTGSTILNDVEALPQCMLFWRSFTHWIGGMGVLIFVMVLTNLDKNSSMNLIRAEVPGPEKDKLMPTAMASARINYAMYFVLTAIETVLLMAGGMNLFDSLVHAFGTAGTGGFSNYGASIGHFQSAYIEYVIAIFMILFGVNFGLYFLMILKEFKVAFKNEELRAYLIIIAVTTGLITINILPQCKGLEEAFRFALFNVATVMTTTGYGTTDFVLWPMFSQCILLALMFIGACASSTGGGMKVSRILIMVKEMGREVKQLAHPKSVNVIRINGKKVERDVLHSLHVYLISYVVIMAGSTLIVALDNFDFATTFTAIIATMNNIGPGIGAVGPTGNFADFSILSKLVMCFDMLAGRLEIFPFLMLFTVTAWNKKF
ncbi:MAG: TrkH family potassium uptake protein [Dorea sp.]|nr:TrkH family potassium uptake protein [Dorea sp.]